MFLICIADIFLSESSKIITDCFKLDSNISMLFFSIIFSLKRKTALDWSFNSTVASDNSSSLLSTVSSSSFKSSCFSAGVDEEDAFFLLRDLNENFALGVSSVFCFSNLSLNSFNCCINII